MGQEITPPPMFFCTRSDFPPWARDPGLGRDGAEKKGKRKEKRKKNQCQSWGGGEERTQLGFLGLVLPNCVVTCVCVCVWGLVVGPVGKVKKVTRRAAASKNARFPLGNCANGKTVFAYYLHIFVYLYLTV
jgi:hypothetical protein